MILTIRTLFFCNISAAASTCEAETESPYPQPSSERTDFTTEQRIPFSKSSFFPFIAWVTERRAMVISVFIFAVSFLCLMEKNVCFSLFTLYELMEEKVQNRISYTIPIVTQAAPKRVQAKACMSFVFIYAPVPTPSGMAIAQSCI